MTIKAYRPGGKVPILGVIWLTLLAVVGGVAMGGLVFLVSRFIYVPLLFPLGMGVSGGGLVAMIVKKRKLSNPLVAGGFGLLIGLVIYGTYQYVGYLIFRQEGLDVLAGQVSDEHISQVFDLIMVEETGSPGFLGYLRWTARAGMTITILIGRAFPLGFTLKSIGVWLYWLIELGLAVGPAAFFAYEAASKPFCHSCQRWYGLSEYIGDVAAVSSGCFLELLEAGNFAQAGKLIIKEEETFLGNLEVKVRLCSCSVSDIVLEVARPDLVAQNRLKRTCVLRGMISPQQYADLLRAMPASVD